MKPMLPVLVLLLIGVVLPAWSGPLRLPKRLGDLTYEGQNTYDEKALGYSLRFETAQENAPFAKADIYVYDNGNTGMRDGIDSEQVKGEMAEVQAVLQQVQELGLYSDVKELGAGQKQVGETAFLWARHAYKQSPARGEPPSQPMLSDTFLLVQSGKFVKVRISSRDVDATAHAKTVDAFMQAFVAELAGKDLSD